MKEKLIEEITRRMLPFLDNFQTEQLQNVLTLCLGNMEIISGESCGAPACRKGNPTEGFWSCLSLLSGWKDAAKRR